MSGQFQSDFTDDPAAIHKAINALMPRPVGAFVINAPGQCPPMDHYEADLIQNQHDQVAENAAIQDAIACLTANMPNQQVAQAQAQAVVYSTAQQVLMAGDLQTQYALRRIDEVLRRLSSLPGQRSIVLVSPGFLTTTFQNQESDIIDRAERSNVFINTLDARGLFTIDPIGDITQDVPQYASTRTAGIASMYRTLSAQANDDIMRDLASGTGGIAFLNSNDLYAGLVQTAGKPEVSYLLAYSPSGLKNDGKFHSIKVKLTGKEHYSLQARRGFFAPKKDVTPEDLVKQAIEDAVFSQEEQATFPVQLHLQYFMTGTGSAKLSVLTHVDVGAVQFDQRDGRHWDDLTVVAALFDRNGNFIEGDEKTLEMRLKDPTLARLEQSGVTIKSSFDVRSGGYLVRLVVRDTKGASIASKNGVVEIP
jgi:VWFA-related protein